MYGLIYGNAVERALDAAYRRKPEAFKGFGGDVLSAMAPPVAPTAFTPLLEAWANKSFFTGQSIESRSLEGLQPQYRSRPATSDTAKAISKTFGQLGYDISPLKVEHVFYGYTAGLGRASIWAGEKAAGAISGNKRNRPILSGADTPVIRAFATPEVPNSPASVAKFYEDLDALRKLRDSRKSAVKIPNGPAAGARELTADEKTKLRRLESAAKQLSGLSARATQIQYDAALAPDEKRKQLTAIQKQKVNTARRALGLSEVYR
jgi:hypothetical protein